LQKRFLYAHIYRRLSKEDEDHDEKTKNKKQTRELIKKEQYQYGRWALKISFHLSVEERKKIDEIMNSFYTEENKEDHGKKLEELKLLLRTGIEKYYFNGHIYSLLRRSRKYKQKQDREVISKETSSALYWLIHQSKEATVEQIRNRRKQLDDNIQQVRSKNRSFNEILRIRAIAARNHVANHYSASWQDAVDAFWMDVHIFRYLIVDTDFTEPLKQEDRDLIEQETLNAINYLLQIEVEYYKGQIEMIETIDKNRKKMSEKIEPIIRRVAHDRVDKSDSSKERIDGILYRVRECLLSDQCHTEYHRYITLKERRELEEIMLDIEKKGANDVQRKKLENTSDIIISDVMSRYFLAKYVHLVLNIIIKEYKIENLETTRKELLKKVENTCRDVLEWAQSRGRSATSSECDSRMTQVHKLCSDIIESHNIGFTIVKTQDPLSQLYETLKEKSNNTFAIYRSEITGCVYIIMLGTIKDINNVLSSKLTFKLFYSFNDRYDVKKFSSQLSKTGDKVDLSTANVISFYEKSAVKDSDAIDIWKNLKYTSTRDVWVKLSRKDNKYVASGLENIIIAQKQPSEHETV
jgi:hypothetical protein